MMTKDIFDCSDFKTGDRVRSRLYGIEGTVTILDIQPQNWPAIQLIEVAWENGKVSHPYANQIEKLPEELNENLRTPSANLQPSPTGDRVSIRK